MEILNILIKSIKEDAQVLEVRRGLNWTAVVSRNCGLASTMAQASCCNEEMAHGMEGSFTKMTALELARYCFNDPAKTSLGLAAINSLIDVNPNRFSDIDGLQLVKDMGKGKNISVIGHFPFLASVAKEARNLWIIERQPRPGDYPEEKASDFLPQSDIVVISSTTLINNSLQGILALCKKGSVKMLLGPTTPLSEALFDFNIDMLSGSIVTEKDIVLRSISEGAGFIQVKKNGGIRFASIIKDYDDIIRRLA